MSEVKKVNTIIGFGDPIIDNSLKSHENDAYFLEKQKKAKESVSKIKFPGYLLNKDINK